LQIDTYSDQKDFIKRIKTGIRGFDNLIEGGLPEKSINLVSGPPGSGKSIFSFQFLYEGAINNETGLFLSLDKNVEGLLIQSRRLGFNFKEYIEDKKIKFRYLNINKKFVYEAMVNEILSGEFNRIILDSITPLSEMPIFTNYNEKNGSEINIINSEDLTSNTNLPQKRLHLHYIINALESTGSTSIITSELPMGSSLFSRDGISEFLADGVIILNFDPTMNRRKISVMKMRNTKHTLKPQDIEIKYGGIQII